MKKGILILVRVAYAVLLVAATLVVSFTLLENHELKRYNLGMMQLLSNYQHSASISLSNVSLSPDACRKLCADLDDPVKIEEWKAYFQHAADLHAELNGTAPRLQDIAELYRARERPQRAEYFRDLVRALDYKQQSEGLAMRELTDLLGKPDSSSNAAGKTVLFYKFTAAATRAVAVVTATNDSISSIVLDRASN